MANSQYYGRSAAVGMRDPLGVSGERGWRLCLVGGMRLFRPWRVSLLGHLVFCRRFTFRHASPFHGLPVSYSTLLLWKILLQFRKSRFTPRRTGRLEKRGGGGIAGIRERRHSALCRFPDLATKPELDFDRAWDQNSIEFTSVANGGRNFIEVDASLNDWSQFRSVLRRWIFGTETLREVGRMAKRMMGAAQAAPISRCPSRRQCGSFRPGARFGGNAARSCAPPQIKALRGGAARDGGAVASKKPRKNRLARPGVLWR